MSKYYQNSQKAESHKNLKAQCRRKTKKVVIIIVGVCLIIILIINEVDRNACNN